MIGERAEDRRQTGEMESSNDGVVWWESVGRLCKAIKGKKRHNQPHTVSFKVLLGKWWKQSAWDGRPGGWMHCITMKGKWFAAKNFPGHTSTRSLSMKTGWKKLNVMQFKRESRWKARPRFGNAPVATIAIRVEWIDIEAGMNASERESCAFTRRRWNELERYFHSVFFWMANASKWTGMTVEDWATMVKSICDGRLGGVCEGEAIRKMPSNDIFASAMNDATS